MGKRIVICCDGTWNSPDKAVIEETSKSGGKKRRVSCPTNVVKIASAVKNVSDLDKKKQLTYYDPGIGTSGWIVKRWFDGATGTGISKNIREAYVFLIKNYDRDDELFFFGFSRGAFTVRSLVGLIRNCGILCPNQLDMVDKAYKLYKSRKDSSHPKEKEATLFRKSFAVSDEVPIKFIGVWDTVGSLGNPLFINNIFSKLSFSVMGNQFHDTTLGVIVENAYQALAIDEKRRLFKPTLWEKKELPVNKTAINQKFEQVWFKGVHSNIGGGNTLSGLSDIALKWIMAKAMECNLDLNQIKIDEKPSENFKQSWKGFYRFIPPLPRIMGNLKNGCESVDIKAATQFNQDNEYHPKNLEDYYSRFPEKKIPGNSIP